MSKVNETNRHHISQVILECEVTDGDDVYGVVNELLDLLTDDQIETFVEKREYQDVLES